MQVIACDGTLFADFLVAGTYFLRKYRSVVNDLNVFPVPDGDTGTNMFFTVRAAMVEAHKQHTRSLKDVAAAAAQGSLMGARGNSGVIISQMFRGFAHAVRHRDAINTLEFASALADGVQAARKALLKPVEGTILSVAGAAANACFKAAAAEPDFYAVLHATVDAANEALEKTPEQLAVLKEAKVVDAGGQGFVYFMEGILRMLPGRSPYTTAFPRNPVRRTTFTSKQTVETHRFCTEFVINQTATQPDALRALLTPHGDSLIVAGGDGTFRVHIHTDYPEKVADMAREHGDVSRLKIDNMEEQHNVLVVDRESKPRGIVAVAPGEGFAKIFKELGADVVVIGGATMNPSVKDLLVAVNKVLAPVVYLLPNDKNIMLAAKEVDALTERRIVVLPTPTVADGVAAMFGLLNHPDDPNVSADQALADSMVAGSGSIFRAGRDAQIGGVSVTRNELVGALEGRNGHAERLVEGPDAAAIAVAMVRASVESDPSLVTLYYGHARRRKEAEAIAQTLKAQFPSASVEAYYGGQPTSDYVISIER
ncbi:MAG: DAK2 domain-containing protein [Candidatus Eremiobacteraeota bacterium]|nr:DAK2 domain-containing protein [Candidatus Eremiobacteraeota bacterium]